MKHDDPLSVERWHRHGNTLTVTLNRVRIAVANLHPLPPTRAEVRLARKVDAVLAEHRRGP